MNKLLLATLLTLPLVATAKNVDLIAAGKTTDTVVVAKCGDRKLITNVDPLPKGCVVVSTHEITSLPRPTEQK